MKISTIAVLVFIIFILLGFFTVASKFGGGEKVDSEKAKVVCKTQKECFWTAHIHATIKVFKGEEQVQLNFEQGKLEGEHTHSEQDKLHWHGLIPVDPNRREVTDWSKLSVGKIPQDLGLDISGEPTFVVNDQEVSSDYVWKDGDIIEIKY